MLLGVFEFQKDSLFEDWFEAYQIAANLFVVHEPRHPLFYGPAVNERWPIQRVLCRLSYRGGACRSSHRFPAQSERPCRYDPGAVSKHQLLGLA